MRSVVALAGWAGGSAWVEGGGFYCGYCDCAVSCARVLLCALPCVLCAPPCDLPVRDMGRVCNRRKNAASKKKGFKKSLDTKRRPRDIDQIQDDLAQLREGKTKFGKELVGEKVVFDEDLPGGGLYYCIEAGRHFKDQTALDAYKKTKKYKKRLKVLKEKQYTQDEADAAGGLQKEVYVPYGTDPRKSGKLDVAME